jgi:hypothetical protein
MKVASHKVFNEGITSSVLRIFEPLFAKFVYRWTKNIANSKGLALEDFYLF